MFSVALVINGNGDMAVSRKAVRPAQTAFLLANDVLPVSLDVRLDPEVNLIDGALVDIRDAYAWVKNELPQLMQVHGITLDTSRIAVIGYSMGGKLAMTTAWALQDASLTPPKAILSFYGPTDLEPVSPIAQVKDGRYHTPTYIAHGTDDEIVPYDSAVKFVQALRDHSVDCGFLTVDGAKHNYDVDLKSATVNWEAKIAPAYEFLFRRLLD
jgi:acetyl esterase/lipase